MIKTEKEYQDSKLKLEQDLAMLERQQSKMKNAGMPADHIEMAMEPLISFTLQIRNEIYEYENLKRGEFPKIVNLHGVGKHLVAYRIFKNMSQKQLAEKLDVAESQVSRDEKNEYHGASVEKIQKVLAALEMQITTEVNVNFRSAI
jgi:DNA-directed RNA polymerase specialized sigma subunit